MTDQNKHVPEYAVPTIRNYDPNMTNSGRKAMQRVELVFQVWDYTGRFIVSVGGNCTGLPVIDAAVENLYTNLPGHPLSDEIAVLHLRSNTGTTMEVEDEDDRKEDWLKDMLVSARILSIEPDGMI